MGIVTKKGGDLPQSKTDFKLLSGNVNPSPLSGICAGQLLADTGPNQDVNHAVGRQLEPSYI